MSAISEDKPKKIGGYDRWDVTSAVDTLNRAQEIQDDPKFLKVVLGEMDKKAVRQKKNADIIAVTAKKLRKLTGKK